MRLDSAQQKCITRQSLPSIAARPLCLPIVWALGNAAVPGQRTGKLAQVPNVAHIQSAMCTRRQQAGEEAAHPAAG